MEDLYNTIQSCTSICKMNKAMEQQTSYNPVTRTLLKKQQHATGNKQQYIKEPNKHKTMHAHTLLFFCCTLLHLFCWNFRSWCCFFNDITRISECISCRYNIRRPSVPASHKNQKTGNFAAAKYRRFQRQSIASVCTFLNDQ